MATIAGNFWSRPESEQRWPVETLIYQTEPDVRVLIHSQRPAGDPKGELILVHGLEGSSAAGYARSMVHAALERGWVTHRFNMRGCGGADDLAVTGYHAGQTSDLLAFLRERRRASALPIFVVGFSLGGNVTLKMAGELGEDAADLLSGVCAVSTPIDLAVCVAALAQPRNFIYQGRFLSRLKDRIRRKNRLSPDVYTLEHLPKIRTIEDFDDHYTARLFGFGTAANYFRTQSSNQFLGRIRVPALLIVAKDDPLVPFPVYGHPALKENPFLTLLAVEHGGHLGFLSRGQPRFWLDGTVLGWAERNVLTPG
ncbi:MAG TPA: alpha/beta fold hydrolase [Bryobacteraceae bacterium]|nr:alpha/beta fold hydrolase [Bryobacteraceae bacterium]